MKVVHTADQPLIRLLNEKNAAHPCADGALQLFSKLIPRLRWLVKKRGLPSLQVMDNFEYMGECFALEAIWAYPDDSETPITGSIMVGSSGEGFVLAIYDPVLGTIFENYYSSDSRLVIAGFSTLLEAHIARNSRP